ncbi:MAG: HNH endonuclease [Burkholderiaceae bacterium]
MPIKMLKPRVAVLKVETAKPLKGSGWRAGKTTNERGYTYAWQQARARFLAENPLCAYCRPRPVIATIVDHRIPHQGDKRLFWDESNWQPLCKPCHDGVKAREEGRGTHWTR